MQPKNLIIIGLVLVILGFVLPVLMAGNYIPSTFFLNFFSFTASLVGLILGIIGAAYYVRENHK